MLHTRLYFCGPIATVGLMLASVAAADVLAPPVSVTASSEFAVPDFAVTNLFDATVSDADVGTTLYGESDGQWAGVGAGPFDVFMDFGSSLSLVDGLAYSQRLGSDPVLDKVGRIDLWFSDTDFGGAIPGTAADASVTISNTTDTILTQYSFGENDFSGRYVAGQFFAPSEGGGNIGGSEFRLTTNTANAINPALTIDRDTGNVTLSNDTSSPVDFVAYEFESPTVGGLEADNWNSIAQNYDAGNAGPNQVSTDDWIEFTPAPFVGNLAEGEQPGGGGATLGVGASIDLGNAWIRNPTEDLTFRLVADDGSLITTDIEYTGEAILRGDYSGNGTIGPEDWPTFSAGLGNTGEGLSIAQAFALGDLDDDRDTDIADFREFEALFNAANGEGALQSLITSSVPEPSTAFLFVCSSLAIFFFKPPRCSKKEVTTITRCPMLLAVAVGTVALCGGREASAQTFTLTSPAVPTGSTANSEFPGFEVGMLFDDNTITGTDLGTREFIAEDPQYAGEGEGPMELFLDYGSSVTANYLAYAQRVGTDPLADKVGQIELWFSNSDFGGVIPGAPADQSVNITELSGLFTPYSLADEHSGQFVAARLNILDASTGQAVNNIGGNELRLATGPSDVTLEVDRSTGSMTILNQGSMAQSLDINGYEIRSTDGSLLESWTGFEDGSVAGFDPSDGSGNGWEKGGSSNANLLAEAFLTGSSTMGTGASLPLGAGYDTSIDAQDLQFSFSVTSGNGLFLPGVVDYVGGGGTLVGDYNNDGHVNAADYVVWRNNLGTSIALPNEDSSATPGQVTEEDYTVWKTNFGNSGSGSLVGTQAVPEAATATLCLAILGAVLGLSHRLRVVGTLVIAGVATLVVAAGDCRAGTPDAVFLFGDNSAAGTENGAAGVEVGQAAGADIAGFTLDHDGELNDGTFRDLAVNPDASGQRPTYIDTAALNFPGTSLGSSTTGVGVRFDGTDDHFTGLGLGNPADGDETFSGDAEGAYSSLFTRMIDGWVRPTNVTGVRQDVVNDTSQFGIHITQNNTWGINYAGNDLDSGIDVAGSLDANGWAHVQHVTTGDSVALLVNGELELVADGGYNATGSEEIVFGANLTKDGNFFSGDLDNFRLLIAGDNSGLTPNGMNYGSLDLSTDNDFIAANVVRGDANGDGIVNGDGMGDETVDDVTFFVNHYFDTQVTDGVTLGDITSITTMADFNGSGRTDIFDWLILRENHQDAGVLQGVDIGALLAARSANIPEPSSMALGMLAMVGLATGHAMRTRRTTHYR